MLCHYMRHQGRGAGGPGTESKGPKEELGWTQRTVEGRWQDGNQLDRTILSFPVSHPQVSDVLISDASTQTEGPEGPLIRTLHDNAGCLVKARAEAILMLLDALIGEEESRARRLVVNQILGSVYIP